MLTTRYPVPAEAAFRRIPGNLLLDVVAYCCSQKMCKRDLFGKTKVKRPIFKCLPVLPSKLSKLYSIGRGRNADVSKNVILSSGVVGPEA